MQVSVQPGHRTSIGNMEDMMLRVAGQANPTLAGVQILKPVQILRE